MSGVQGALCVSSENPLLAPLRIISLCQIACSEAGCTKYYPARLSALLCCDFALRSDSIGCSCAHSPLLSSRVPYSRLFTEIIDSVSRHERGPAIKAHAWRGMSARAADRFRSQSKIASAAKPEGRRRIVLCTDSLRGCDLAKRDEAQGGRGRCAFRLHHPTCLLKPRNSF